MIKKKKTILIFGISNERLNRTENKYINLFTIYTQIDIGIYISKYLGDCIYSAGLKSK